MGTPSSEPPILSRLERLDLMLRYLEEMRRSSFTSTASSGDGDGEGGDSPLSASAKRIEKKARPVAEVAAEAEMKGSLLDRLTHLEHRILKLSMRIEEEIESEKKSEEEKSPRGNGEKKRHKLKQLVKSCVKGGSVKDKE
ncbi:hypothetical protein J5N97_010578 [Dioscorea zingiberensis]|uniref:Uncharacterized protein n=1 Tax=Dioscorea zingiberensis TaxID=325984 RepID=A0A9D5HMS9_9LILI|nr:hypothetical protein J5N97_010578 [Dioscorea zingiberensis]